MEVTWYNDREDFPWYIEIPLSFSFERKGEHLVSFSIDKQPIYLIPGDEVSRLCSTDFYTSKVGCGMIGAFRSSIDSLLGSVKCLGWLCPASLLLLLFETPILTLCLPAPRNKWCGNACFGAQVSWKDGTWYSERVILQFICVGCWAGVTYPGYTDLTSTTIRAKQLSTVAILLYRFLSCWCLETFFT